MGLFLTAALSFAQRGGNQSQQTPSPGFRVLDRNNTLVGHAIGDKMVARDIGGIWVAFFIHPAVGIYDSGAIYLHYLTTDCSGPAYVTHYSTFAEGTRVGPKLYYPTDSLVLNPPTLRVADGNGGMSACTAASGIEGIYGPAASVDVDSFKLQLPFRAVP